jgi:hypothetical protein
MEKVYLVYYDNGERWEDHAVRVDMIFASEEKAVEYAEQKNAEIQTYTPSVTREKYESENWDEDTRWSYDEFIENEQYDWSMMRDSKYYVSAYDVCH